MTKTHLIAAVDLGGSIGWADGRLPWKLKHDMARFKQLTTGASVVMGMNTFRSLKRPNGLPNRCNYVLSKHFDVLQVLKEGVNVQQFLQNGAIGENVYVRHDLAALVKELETGAVTSDLWICGGAQVYQEALALDVVSDICLTVVHTTSNADVKLHENLTDVPAFISRQRGLGINWTIADLRWDPQVEDQPLTTFVRLQRM